MFRSDLLVEDFEFPTLGLPRQKIDLLKDYLSLVARSSPPNTVRAIRSDVLSFEDFCRSIGAPAVPADLGTVRAYIRFRADNKVRADTISRALSHMGHLHDALGMPNPFRHRFVRLELKTLRKDEAPPRQATAVSFEALNAWEAGAPDKSELPFLRDRAILWLGYDSLLRREELARVQISWIEDSSDGDGTLLLPNHKGDQENKGSYLYLSERTLIAVDKWRAAAGISGGALFRSFSLSGSIRDGISPSGINDVVKKRALEMGIGKASSHSLRIGAAQDLLEAGASTAQLQLAGRWKSEKMPAIYARKLEARRGAMAKLAENQGRSTKRAHKKEGLESPS